MSMMNKCYTCDHRRTVSGDCHSACVNTKATVIGSEHGRNSGWFYWPINFDPVWLEECNGYKKEVK